MVYFISSPYRRPRKLRQRGMNMSDKFSKYAATPEQEKQYREDKFSKYRATPEQIEAHQRSPIEEGEPEDKEATGFGGVAQDILSKGIQTPFDLFQGAMEAPGEGYGAIKQLLTNYPRYAGNAVAGFGELGHKLLS